MIDIFRFLQGKSKNAFKLDLFQRIVCSIMGLLHVFFLIIFAITKIRIMVIVNIFSILIYITALYFVKKKKYVLSFKLSFYEVMIHLAFVVPMIGDECGFRLYSMALIPVIYYYYFLFSITVCKTRKNINPLFYSLISLGVSISLYIYSIYNHPVYDYLTKQGRKTVFTINYIMVILALIIFMAVAITQIMSMHEQLEKYAMEDFLTGLLNRRSINELMEKYQTEEINYALILCDIDDFKGINDSYGHEFGDRILERIAEILQSETRKSDYVSRWGGEEILILLPLCTKIEAIDIAEKLRNKIKDMVVENRGTQISTTMTFGVSDSSECNAKEDIIHLADQRLYIGKKEGKNKVVS